VRAPAKSAPFLAEKAKALKSTDSPRLARLIAALDDERFAVRQKAEAALREAGPAAAPALRAAEGSARSAEATVRLDRLLEAVDTALPQGDELRWLRAVAALEAAGTPEARAVLVMVRERAPGSRPAVDAAAALRRLGE
jgi:hypothetical protein